MKMPLLCLTVSLALAPLQGASVPLPASAALPCLCAQTVTEAQLQRAQEAVRTAERYVQWVQEDGSGSAGQDTLFQAQALLFAQKRLLLRLLQDEKEETQLVREHAARLQQRAVLYQARFQQGLVPEEAALRCLLDYQAFLAQESRFLP